MAILVLSIFVSAILGSVVWLIIGSRMPPREEIKLPAFNNIVIYSALLVIPVYLFIFFVIG